MAARHIDNPLMRAGFESLSDARRGSLPYVVATMGSESSQVQHLMSEECDVLLECRVCRNFFRNLEDFVEHKSSNCTNSFNPVLKTEGVSQFISHSQIHAGFRTPREFYDEIAMHLERPSQQEPIQLQFKPLVDQGSQLIVCQEVVKEGCSSEAVVSPITNSWHAAKKDTAVLDLNGKIIGTGTGSEMALIASEVGAQVEQMIQMGTPVEAPPFKIKTLMCKTCKIILGSKGILGLHESNCEKHERVQLARLQHNFGEAAPDPDQPEFMAMTSSENLSPESNITSGEEVEVEYVSSEN